jgi:outer membrane protein TolC
MKKFILLLFIPVVVSGQGSLTLDSCYKKAFVNDPTLQQKYMLNTISDLRTKNLNTAYYPQLSINGQATYQSDVTTLPIHIPGMDISTLDKDGYKATIDLTQTIYDGGYTKKQKGLESVSLQIEQQNLESDMYKVKEKINTLYFSILLFQENKDLLLVMKEDINSRLKKIKSGIKNGIGLESNANSLEAEMLKIDQQVVELDANITASFKMLGDYLNSPIPESTKLLLPTVNAGSGGYDNNRMEMKVFDLQIQKLKISESLLGVKTMPKLSAFGQMGYGKPGLNMLSNEFDSFYMFGARLSWSFWNWNQNKREKQILELQSNVINTQKELFDRSLKILMEKNISDMNKYDELISQDQQIIALREKIVQTATSQLENGTITATEYLTELNAKAQAELNLKTHTLQQLKARVDYLTTKGSM